MEDEIEALAAHVSEYLAEVHPEARFRILLRATQLGTLDSALFVQFVLLLFERDPQQAVPLCLLLDWHRLTEEQRNEIFQCREMHELAMGYFLAAAMSLARATAGEKLSASTRRIYGKLKRLQKEIEKRQTEGKEAVEKEDAQTMAELKEICEKQRAAIAELKTVRDARKKAIAENVAEFERQMGELRTELERQKEMARQKREEVEERRQAVQKEIAGGMTKLREGLGEGLAEEKSRGENWRADVAQQWGETAERQRAEAEEQDNTVRELEDGAAEIRKSIGEWRAVFAAMALRERIRGDGWARKIDERFGELAKTAIWEISEDQLREADVIVERLEQRRGKGR
jgi:DNA repair exonuclease SbcCD ATPase subunit